MITSDQHIHSFFSTDSEAEPQLICEQAIAAGLTSVCFTDHMDYMYPDVEGSFLFEPSGYFTCLQEIREKYHGRLDVRIGVELGLRDEADCQDQVLSMCKSLTSSYPFDLIIGSTHVLEHQDPYYPSFWTDCNPKDVFLAYLKSIAKNCETYADCFHICGHLDYLLRYIPSTHGGEHAVSDSFPEDYWDSLTEILTTLIKHGNGIEINTNGKETLSFVHPKLAILKLYKKLGGDIITIGSDAHTPACLGKHFPLAAELLTAAGYNAYTVFVGGKPEWISLH